MMRRLYDPLVKREENFITMNWESSELTKYAGNSMLAARISFMNELTILCEHYGADIEDIRKGIGSDSRIGPSFLKAGCGYGGSCFPKDVAAMEHISKLAGHESLFVNAIQTINKNQKKRFVEKIVAKLGRPIEGATIAVWGLAFKADTDDIRESASIDVIEHLLEKGAIVRAHDYKGQENMKQAVQGQPDRVGHRPGHRRGGCRRGRPVHGLAAVHDAAVPQDLGHDEHADHLRRPQLPEPRSNARERLPVLPDRPPGRGADAAAAAAGVSRRRRSDCDLNPPPGRTPRPGGVRFGPGDGSRAVATGCPAVSVTFRGHVVTGRATSTPWGPRT